MLYGPNGLPIETFRKGTQPKLGPAFGDWAGRDTLYNQLPGGAVLSYDLNRLTLADFRAMRAHPQINASLCVLAFMMHQLDWWIECEDKKIAAEIDTMVRNIWTRLIRAVSQAYWAGFSPNALEFDNDVEGRRTIITKVKDLLPEECMVHWKYVEGYAPPNHARPKFREYDGIRQVAKSQPIPPENCVHPDTPVLCADFIWRPAGTLVVGQKIITFDENDSGERGGLGGRAYRTGEIIVNNAGIKSCVEVRTEANEIIASMDHPFLVRAVAGSRSGTTTRTTGDGVTCPQCGDAVTYSGTRIFHRTRNKNDGINYRPHWVWKNASDLEPGDQIAYFGDPAAWEYDGSRDAGWIAGMFDGEGSISPKGLLSVSQNDGVVLDRLKQLLAEKGFDFSVTSNTRDRCVQLALRGGIRETARFLTVFRPLRLCANLTPSLDGTWIKINKSVDLVTVTSVVPVGDQPIASIQTSTGTFITNGSLSHNSLWYPLLMENGNYYGRKLLKPAFGAWYFSQLMHLFANRYYERFGEPLPIGRAPFDEVIDTKDDQGNDTQISGKTAMELILRNLRNRSVVVLPNDRTVVGTSHTGAAVSYDYQIEYLESQMRGADFERYMSRLDEEMSLGIFTPVLLFRTADVGSYNLGVSHMQIFLWMLNALAGDLKEYLDNYIVDRLKTINWGPRAKKAEWQFRKMGKESAALVQTVLDELIKGGKATVDLDELGMIAGLKIKEVRQLVPDPNADPNADPPADPNAPKDTRVRVRPKPKTGPKGVGQPRATTRQISNRIAGQVEKAWREKTFGSSFNPTLGYKRRFEESLKAEGSEAGEALVLTDQFYERVQGWLNDAIGLGMEEYAGPSDFMSMFDRVLDIEIDELL